MALKAYFRGLIFVVCPELVIIVPYYLDFRGLIFRLGLSITKISCYIMVITQSSFMVMVLKLFATFEFSSLAVFNLISLRTSV